jgi:hypothetical protein
MIIIIIITYVNIPQESLRNKNMEKKEIPQKKVKHGFHPCVL